MAHKFSCNFHKIRKFWGKKYLQKNEEEKKEMREKEKEKKKT